MAINEALTNRVREVLSGVNNIEEKKMFRGIAFMVNGKMCVSVGDQEIMCRIDPAIHAAVMEKNGCRTVIMRGKEMKGYVYVHEQEMKTQKALEYWVGLALDFNERAKASVKKKKK